MEDKNILQSNLITNATYNHTALEESILSYIAYFMKPDETDNFYVKISLDDLRTMTKKTLSYNYMKKLSHNLTSVKYFIKFKDVKGTKYQSIFPDSGYKNEDFVVLNCILKSIYNSGKATLNLEVNKEMVPFFSDLKEQFTIYNFSSYMKLKSFYSKRFFAIFSMFRSTGIFKKRVDDLRETFGLKDQYSEYKNFKSRVIIPALKEINTDTNFTVELEEVKEGKKVETLIFRFSDDSKKTIIAPVETITVEAVNATNVAEKPNPLNDKVQRLQLRLQEIGLEAKTISFALEKYQATPNWKIWPEVNKTKSAMMDKKEFPNKFTLKKFIEGK